MDYKRTSKKVGFNKKLVFYIDKIIKRSFLFQLLCLSFIVTAIVVVAGLLAMLVNPQKNILGNFWWAFLRVTDPGYLGEDQLFNLGLLGSLVIVAGLIVFGLLITIISTAFQHRLEALKKGRIPVIECGHSLILGWGGVVYSVIDELLHADKMFGDRRKQKPIVILSDTSREEMETKIVNHCKNIGRDADEIITRTGDTRSLPDLEMVNLQQADEIIILMESGGGHKRANDAKIIQTLFAAIKTFNSANASSAIQGQGQSTQTEYALKIALWVYEKDTIGIFSHLGTINPHMFINILTPNDFIPRLIAQASIEPGLEKIYSEFFSFEGQSFFIKKLHDLGVKQSMPFSDLLYGFAEALPVGYKKSGDKTLLLNPSRDQHLLSPDDSLIYIAATRDQHFNGVIRPDPAGYLCSNKPILLAPPQKAIVLGEGEKVNNIIRYMQHYLPKGSTLLHVAEELKDERWPDENITTKYIQDDNSLHSHLAILNKELPCDIIVLADTDSEIDSHDSEILLKITDIKSEELKQCIPNEKRALIVAEFLDPQNAKLVSVIEEDSFSTKSGANKVEIISTEYISRYLVQTLKNPDNATVFAELMDPTGREIGTRPLDFFIDLDRSPQGISFRDVMAAAHKKGHTAIGYFEKNDPGRRSQFYINPPKTNALQPNVDIICIADFFD